MFMYHMMGEHTGSLIVTQRPRGSQSKGKIQWALHGNQGTQWTQGAVTLSLGYDDEVGKL